MIILDGKTIAEKIESNLQVPVGLKLAIILVGNDPASVTYTNMKKKKCEKLGIQAEIYQMPQSVSEQDLLDKIKELNSSDTTGILVQLPLPKQMDQRKVLDAVDPKKDVDGLHSENLKRIMMNKEGILPATPKAVLTLLKEYNIELEGKNVCIVGYGDTVGKPLAFLCLNREASVDVCHIKTKDLKEHTIRADIIMSAAGVPDLIKEDMIKQEAVIIDIGISKVDGKITGDVDFDNVKEKCAYITPVPGGIGPMTIVSLIENLVSLKG